MITIFSVCICPNERKIIRSMDYDQHNVYLSTKHTIKKTLNRFQHENIQPLNIDLIDFGSFCGRYFVVTDNSLEILT